MGTLTRSAVRFAAAMLLATAIAGCDDEPGQRKAFIEFLQTRIVAKPGIHVPKLTAEEAKSFGDYARHYAVIADFNAGMDANVSKPLQQAMAAGAPHSLDEVVTRRKDIAAMRDGMATIRGALDTQLATADAAHASLKQPDDLKPVYDKAYDRDVTQPAKAMADIFPDADSSMQAILALAEFLEQNKDKVKVNGSLVEVKDPSVQGRLQALVNALQAKQEGIQKAQKRLHDVAYGG
jgi:hypothetical protein